MKNWKTTTLGILLALSEAFKHSDNVALQSWGNVLFQICVPLGFLFSADSSHPALNGPGSNPVNPAKPLGVVLLCFLTVTLASGCATGGTGLAGIAAQLKDDPAILVVRGKAGTPWGEINNNFTRIGGTTNSVTIAPDGTVTINAPVK